MSRHLANKIVKDVNLPGINDQEAMLSALYFANFQIAFWAKTHLRYLCIHGQCIRKSPMLILKHQRRLTYNAMAYGKR